MIIYITEKPIKVLLGIQKELSWRVVHFYVYDMKVMYQEQIVIKIEWKKKSVKILRHLKNKK